jgi:hypothetical protein
MSQFDLGKIYSSITKAETDSQVENDIILNEFLDLENYDNYYEVLGYLNSIVGDLIPDKLYFVGTDSKFMICENEEFFQLQINHKNEHIRYCYKK